MSSDTYLTTEDRVRPARVPSGPTPARSAYSQRRSRIDKIVALLAACLATGFFACIILSAADSNPGIWPFGAESFSIESHGLLRSSDPLDGVSAAWTATCCLVTTAGAYLVIRHRARSALVADGLLASLALNMAEPWDRT